MDNDESQVFESLQSPFQNRSSRREEALIYLRSEPRYLGCYEVLKLPPSAVDLPWRCSRAGQFSSGVFFPSFKFTITAKVRNTSTPERAFTPQT